MKTRMLYGAGFLPDSTRKKRAALPTTKMRKGPKAVLFRVLEIRRAKGVGGMKGGPVEAYNATP